MMLSRGRVTLKNEQTARIVADAFLPQSQEGSEGKVVIEAFPGKKYHLLAYTSLTVLKGLVS